MTVRLRSSVTQHFKCIVCNRGWPVLLPYLAQMITQYCIVKFFLTDTCTCTSVHVYDCFLPIDQVIQRLCGALSERQR